VIYRVTPSDPCASDDSDVRMLDLEQPRTGDVVVFRLDGPEDLLRVGRCELVRRGERRGEVRFGVVGEGTAVGFAL
jgi:hypothetical protein